MDIDLKITLKETRLAAKLAAKYIKSHIGQVAEDEIVEKDLNSLVSYVDQNAEKILVKALKKILPFAGFLTEEDTENEENEDYVWVIDPLDGTTNFLMNVPHFAVSVALNYKSETIVGVVIEVNSGEEFYAAKGLGAFLNDKVISVRNNVPLSGVLIATGFPYTNAYDISLYLKVLEGILTRTRGLRRMGSAALDLCYVACGRFGAYYESRLNPWDIAAGALIVKEAGGQVTDFSGGFNDGSGREILACTPSLYEEIVLMISPVKGK
jgi:myo-inositol-1(or 4)-monophosphatase